MRRRTALAALLALILCPLPMLKAQNMQNMPSTVETALQTVRDHTFHPLDGKSFTVDRDLGRHGIANTDDKDWRIRLLAVRDLVTAGEPALPDIIAGLENNDMQVRYVCATALGVLRAEQAVPDLQRVLRDDPEMLVRSQVLVRQ